MEPTFFSSMKDNLKIARELRHLQIYFFPEKCKGIWQCYEVCPVGCWTQDVQKRTAIFHHPERCVACGACVLQCPEDAIELS